MDWLEEAIKLEATPKTLRQETIRDFCARMSIPESNYYYHINKKENKAKVLEMVLNVAKTSAPDILKKLVERAEEGDMKAIDMYMDMILQLSKNLDVKTDGKPIFIPSEIASKYGINTNNSTEADSK
jgi:hypothetical protein